MLAVSYLPLLKIVLALSLWLFLPGDNQLAESFLVFGLAIQAAVMFWLGKRVLVKHIRRSAGRVAMHDNIKINTLRIVGLIGASLTLCAYATKGVPLIASDVNAAKVSLSDSWLLMRGVRFVIPVIIFIRAFTYFSDTRAKLSSFDIYLLALFFMLALASGYKGYVLVYIFLPVVFAYSLYSFSRPRLLIGATIGLLIFATLLTNISMNEGLSYSDSLEFLLLRTTYSQAEGAIIIVNNISTFAHISPIGMNIESMLSRLFSGGEALNFNAYIFETIHGDNPLKMQISVPLYLEGFVETGFLGGTVTIFMELVFFLWLLSMLKRKKSFWSLGISYAVFMSFMDLSMNGGVIMRLIDLFISIILLGFCYFIARILGSPPSVHQRTPRFSINNKVTIP